MTFIFAVFLGIYPVSMPAGQEQLAEQVGARVHRGASSVPGVRPFDVLAHSSCAPADNACLAGAAQRAGLAAVVSTEVSVIPDGYRWVLRDISSEGKLLAEQSGELKGGGLELAAALEQAARDTLPAAHATGWLRVRDGEQRSLVPSSEVNSVHQPEPRVDASKVMVGGGIALLAAGGALGLLTQSTASSGKTGVAAAALAATGAGAIIAGGFMFALSPNGVAVAGEF